MQNKFRVLEELVAAQRAEIVHLTNGKNRDPPRVAHAPKYGVRQASRKKKTVKRKVASKDLKKLRKKFNQAFMEKVDARYLAPKHSYKIYADGKRGETINGAKFIKIVGPLLKKLEALLSGDDEPQVVRQVCFVFFIFFVFYNTFDNFLFANFLFANTDAKQNEEAAGASSPTLETARHARATDIRWQSAWRQHGQQVCLSCCIFSPVTCISFAYYY